MCGIAGYRLVEGDVQPWVKGLPKSVASLRHRGPDDEGIWFGDEHRVGLGHRRLSILDLSSHGHQPMASACGTWQMVFNGEVYNFKAIRSQLEGLRHRFRGTGDSEVILAAFSEWGIDAVKRFIGMFAIALWHVPTRRLHLVRDRIGVKPLFYRWDGKALCFGSELKALRAFSGWSAEIEGDAISDYLRYAYINDPRTIYRHVFQLPPAHHFTLDACGNIDVQRYWNVIDIVGLRNDRSEAELTDELEALMIDAFKYRMIADVPVGVFLSGGIDSSVVAALLQKHGGQRLKTYTIGFDVPEFDESSQAATVARHLETDHHSRILKTDDAKKLLSQWGDLYDEPFGDPSGIPTLMVSQVAAEQVKVVLSADGGDELFWGYSGYASTLSQWNRIRSAPGSVRRAIARTINCAGVPQMEVFYAGRSGSTAARLGAAFSRLTSLGLRLGASGVGAVYDEGLGHFTRNELAILTGRAAVSRSSADVYPGTDGEKLCLWDLHNYLPGNILTKVDRATMSVSIEGREPLLDHRLVEFAFSLPFDLRRGELGSKHLLKKVLYRYVPRRFVDRPKRGFGVPVKEWLSGDLGAMVDDYLNVSEIARQGLFNPAMIGDYVRRLHRGDHTVRQRVWLLVAFQMWHRRWALTS